MADQDKPAIIFQPHHISERVEKTIVQRYTEKDLGLDLGIDDLDNVFLPLRPGELFGVLAFTSNGKSSVMSYIMRHHAYRLRELYKVIPDHKKIVVSATWEQSIEEQGIVDVAQITHHDTAKIMRGAITDAELIELQEGAKQRGKLPWWLIGHSLFDNTRRPRLTMSQIDSALAHIEQLGFEPILISLDYLQRIRREKMDMREGYMDIVDKSKDLSLASHCPVMLGCQAKREVQQRKWKLPNKDDAQETSNFEQSCDKMLSLWMPKNDVPQGKDVPYGEHKFKTTQTLMLTSIQKQKFGKAPVMIPLNLRAATNEIYGYADEHGNPYYYNR